MAEICPICTQQNCRRSSRSAESFSISLNHPHFRNGVAIPCHFKKRLNHFADNWLPAVASGHRFKLFLVKREEATYIKGPFWTRFLRSHNIALHDVVTFRLITQDEEEEEEEDVPEENPLNRSENVFRMVAHDPAGNIKQFQIDGMSMPDVDPLIRGTFYRSVFTDMDHITEADMCSITFEMMKEVNKQRLLHEDEFFHLSDLQYFITRLHPIYVANNRLAIPSSFTPGFKISRNGTALFLSYGMDNAIPRDYTIHRGINTIMFSNGWNIFCNVNHLVAGSLIDVRVEMRQDCIGLFVTRIH